MGPHKWVTPCSRKESYTLKAFQRQDETLMFFCVCDILMSRSTAVSRAGELGVPLELRVIAVS